jgi:phenylpropionate dioxygenase-like ring-hydroxylating dioxygenase large terminal subunit
MAAHAGHLGAYRIADMQPRRRPWSDIVKADWKNVMDNYLECYHCPLGHPGLSCLMQPDYANLPDDASRTALFYHDMREEPPRGWSQKHYNRLLPDVETLPDTLKRRWSYLFAVITHVPTFGGSVGCRSVAIFG